MRNRLAIDLPALPPRRGTVDPHESRRRVRHGIDRRRRTMAQLPSTCWLLLAVSRSRHCRGRCSRRGRWPMDPAAQRRPRLRSRAWPISDDDSHGVCRSAVTRRTPLRTRLNISSAGSVLAHRARYAAVYGLLRPSPSAATSPGAVESRSALPPAHPSWQSRASRNESCARMDCCGRHRGSRSSGAIAGESHLLEDPLGADGPISRSASRHSRAGISSFAAEAARHARRSRK